MPMKHAALLGLAIAVACAAGVSAHERKTAGPLMLVIGWGDEPAYAGFKNAVEIDVSDAAGPVVDAEGRLSVDVAFGDTRVTLPLRAVGRTPGKFR